MRVLLTGGNGQLGTTVREVWGAKGDEILSLDLPDFDVSNRDQVLQQVHAFEPELVLHGGAITNVDGCETDPDLAFRVNALGSRFVAEAANQVGARVLYVSTDYVFNGQAPADGRPYGEWDRPDPQSVYGRSKLAGEQETLGLLGARGTVVRIAWAVSPYGHNFVKTMLRLADDLTVSPTVVNDQIGCPTFAGDLAPMLRDIAVRRAPGIFHATNTGPVSWCDFAKAIFAEAGADPDRVRPVTSEQYAAGRTATTAPRPAFSVLGHTALQGLGLAMPPWQPALTATIAQLRTAS